MLKIGQIDFANLYPIFYGLNRQLKSPDYQFIKGPPSHINHLLENNEIDVGPCSSIEYLRSGNIYNLIPGHSISAVGEIKSISLFSALPINELSCQSILTTYKSETSSALLRVILERFLGLKANITISKETLKQGLKNNSAYLLIGDDALNEACINGFMDNDGILGNRANDLYLYDLSLLWYQYTGLPFVFALWLSSKDAAQKTQYNKFIAELDNAKINALSELNVIAQSYPSKGVITESLLLAYWNTISYDLTDLHLKGLELFRQYLIELKII
ncbi:MAG: menaquinone biosynthesis protein [Nitrospirae bacterium]|nr:menaquinone biosynthesis protein [Nitrospirota bacterium]